MTLEPLLRAPFAIQLHVATVLPAFLLGTWLIVFSRKGAPYHRALGLTYLTLMSATAIDALFIHALNPHGFLGLSPVHLLVPLTLWAVYNALAGARAHDIARHRWSMLSLYVGGMLVAGALAFWPGRIMHLVVFGS